MQGRSFAHNRIVGAGEAEKGTFSASPTAPKDAKSLAEERLREMMKQAGSESGESGAKSE